MPECAKGSRAHWDGFGLGMAFCEAIAFLCLGVTIVWLPALTLHTSIFAPPHGNILETLGTVSRHTLRLHLQVRAFSSWTVLPLVIAGNAFHGLPFFYRRAVDITDRLKRTMYVYAVFDLRELFFV